MYLHKLIYFFILRNNYFINIFESEPDEVAAPPTLEYIVGGSTAGNKYITPLIPNTQQSLKFTCRLCPRRPSLLLPL
jgi:hypothetical protein